MGRGRRTGADQLSLSLCQPEVRTARGESSPEHARRRGFSEQSYRRWHQECDGLQIDQARRVNESRREDALAPARG